MSQQGSLDFPGRRNEFHLLLGGAAGQAEGPCPQPRRVHKCRALGLWSIIRITHLVPLNPKYISERLFPYSHSYRWKTEGQRDQITHPRPHNIFWTSSCRYQETNRHFLKQSMNQTDGEVNTGAHEV